MRKIVTMRFGSQLYGTSTPESDVDLISIHVPDARDILLQRVRNTIGGRREKAPKEKNFPGEVDENSYSLQQYLRLLAEGQTVAIDILFAPSNCLVGPICWEWPDIVAARGRLLTKKSAAFLGYCRQQANKYGIKGSRVAAARLALRILETAAETYGRQAKLSEITPLIAGNTAEHLSIEDIDQGSGAPIKHWSVCGRKLQYTASIGHALTVVQKLVDEYGQRALQAESQQGVDWKALYHAVRVGREAVELLQTGHVTFPLRDREHLLAIKLGQKPYDEVAAEIESLLLEVEAAAIASKLPAEPDQKWIDDFVADVYRKEVLSKWT